MFAFASAEFKTGHRFDPRTIMLFFVNLVLADTTL